MKKNLLLFLVITIAIPAFSQDISAKLDTMLVTYAKQDDFSGSVLAARKGTVLFEKGYGLKDKRAMTLNDVNTIFQIGSITKQFTSAIILQLQEKNKLSLQDKLSKY